jgi:hypothetical protein
MRRFGEWVKWPSRPSAGWPSEAQQSRHGCGAAWRVTAEDDIYEQYKKRMMLGYHYRLNPLVSRSFYPKKHCSLFSHIEFPFRIRLLTYTRLFRMVFLREWMSYPLNI